MNQMMPLEGIQEQDSMVAKLPPCGQVIETTMVPGNLTVPVRLTFGDQAMQAVSLTPVEQITVNPTSVDQTEPVKATPEKKKKKKRKNKENTIFNRRESDNPDSQTDRRGAACISPKQRRELAKLKRRADDHIVGTARGIETMFRNSYRAQLDLIALAATKANIMISVNGFILSMLIVSESFMVAREPLLFIPSALFLFTCMISIILAVLAARPKAAKGKHHLDEFREDQANLLVHEEFARLSKEDFIEGMDELMKDKGRIYKTMTGQLYWLGRVADKKFKLLHYSYTVFMSGLVVSIALFLCVMLIVKVPPVEMIQ